MKKIGRKQSNLSEMTDELVNTSAQLIQIYDTFQHQEVIETSETERREKHRVRLDNKLARLENQIFSGRIDEAKETVIEIRHFEEHQRDIEAQYEKIENDYLELNSVKLEEAIEELRETTRRFEKRYLDERG